MIPIGISQNVNLLIINFPNSKNVYPQVSIFKYMIKKNNDILHKHIPIIINIIFICTIYVFYVKIILR